MTKKSRILVVGGGGREHALVWKLKQSDLVEKICCAPGNGGISQDAEVFDLPKDFLALENIVRSKGINYIIVGPEIPLVEGIVDYFTAKGISIFGPNRIASQLEGSKIYSKNFMKKYSVPTANFEVFNESITALDYLKGKEDVVIKADGLCAGKGVVVSSGYEESRETIEKFMQEKIFGNAGANIIVEEKLRGEEASVLVVVSGNNYGFLIPSQDHKAVFEGDKGPNTGGMGAYAPTAVIDEKIIEKIERKIVIPVLEGFEAEGINYNGILYIGLMIDGGEPSVLEFNVRFGDPETEVVLPMMENDLLEALYLLEEGSKVDFKWKKGCCIDVVLASEGYPGKYPKGRVIEIDKNSISEDVYVFHAGTELKEGKIYTSGGRVLNVAAIGEDISDAGRKAYETVSKIHFDGMYFRKDIGYKELARSGGGVKSALDSCGKNKGQT